MAIRLSIAFETSAESWLQQQLHYDLWQAEQHRSTFRVQKLAVA
jgi:antitoxin HigA-1